MEESYKPDLIVMDGGIQQINACKEVLESLNIEIPIIGLVKDDKHRTNHIMNDKYELLEVDTKIRILEECLEKKISIEKSKIYNFCLEGNVDVQLDINSERSK